MEETERVDLVVKTHAEANGRSDSGDEALQQLLRVVRRQAHGAAELAHGHHAEGEDDQRGVVRVPVLVLDLRDPDGREGDVSQHDVDRRIRVGLQVDEQQQEVGGGEDVVECVPLQLGEEHAHVERVAEVVEEACGELEDSNVQLEVAAVAVHDHKRRQERHIGEHLEAEGERALPHGHAAAVVHRRVWRGDRGESATGSRAPPA
mmetsp:Transcript_19522/g.46801  ORF Transcript_19522/g.46801 Transcript_19522/m.46801 type:complete len:205 (-) Transcript_19522:8-622(-)